MRIDLLTLFPDMCRAVLDESIIGRAQAKGLLDIRCHQIRDYTLNKQKQVDDYPYGGGLGMVMNAQPIADCFRAVCAEGGVRPHLIYMSPQGAVLTQQRAKELAQLPRFCVLCGHYEGVDERVLDALVDEQISMGDYVLTGGELPPWLWWTACPAWCPACSRRRAASPRRAITPACWNTRSIPVPRSGRAGRSPTCSSPATISTSPGGAASSPCCAPAGHRPDMLEKAELTPEDRAFLQQTPDE